MKRIALLGTATALALTAMAAGAMAHSAGGPQGGRFGCEPGMGRGPIFDFAQTDADGDGKVTMEEIQAAGQARLDAAFEAIDSDGNGAVTKEEITAYMETRAEAQRAARRDQAATRMMDFADADEDGVLTRDEVFPQPRGDGSFFSRFDTDEDGAISEEEFAAAQARFQGRMGGRGMGEHGREGQGGKRGMGMGGREHGADHGPRGERGMGGDGLMRLFLDAPVEAPAE